MTLSPSQQAWADEQVGTERTATHSGVITKVTSKKDGWTATVEAPDKTVATFDLMGVVKATADEHVGVEATVAVTGTVTKIVTDPARTEVGLAIKTATGTTVEWVAPPPMTEAEHAELYPVPTPEEQAAAEEQAQADAADAEAARVEAERDGTKARLLYLLANDADVQAAIRGV